jgi:hypothetical protein
MAKRTVDGLSTPVSVEGIFDSHATALALPARTGNESLEDYAERVSATAITPGRKTEVARCLTEAAAAATIADHPNTHHWLNQARQHLPTD